MPTVGLATSEQFADLIPDDRPLAAVLEDAGVAAVPAVWTDDAVDWAAFDLVLIRTTWDYFDRREEFVVWAERVARAVPLWNPAEVVRWNTHKTYLRDLEARGAPVVPTVWAHEGELAPVLEERGWDDAVVKPAVGVGARGMLRVAPGEGEEHFRGLLARGHVLVQPFLPSIEHGGELSVVWIDGAVSHAVRKRPAAGDIRVQPEYGATVDPVELDPDEGDVVERVLAAACRPLLYARVDLVRDAAGAPRLIELEAVEPRLFLEAVPGAAERLAAAVLDRLP